MSVVHASALSLVVISLERYHVICQPLQAGYRCTKAKAMVAILVIWVVAFLSAGLVCVGYPECIITGCVVFCCLI